MWGHIYEATVFGKLWYKDKQWSSFYSSIRIYWCLHSWYDKSIFISVLKILVLKSFSDPEKNHNMPFVVMVNSVLSDDHLMRRGKASRPITHTHMFILYIYIYMCVCIYIYIPSFTLKELPTTSYIYAHNHINNIMSSCLVNVSINLICIS